MTKAQYRWKLDELMEDDPSLYKKVAKELFKDAGLILDKNEFEEWADEHSARDVLELRICADYDVDEDWFFITDTLIGCDPNVEIINCCDVEDLARVFEKYVTKG